MRGLILLALLGIAVADRLSSDYFVGKRLDSTEMRLGRIRHEIEELSHLVHDDDERQYIRVVEELERRIGDLEVHDCSDHQFLCGRNSGQCVADILVCDGVADCDNGHDEDKESTCDNQAPAGRSWSGTASWYGCVNRGHNEMNLLITGNRRLTHFPSRMWVDAVIVDKWTEDQNEMTKTWTTHGYYDYAHRRVVLDPPDHSDKRIGLVCDDAGEGIADCKMVREFDQSQCGHATLTREV